MMCREFQCGCVAVTEIPMVACVRAYALRCVVENQINRCADGIGNIEIRNDSRKIEVEFYYSDIAVCAAVVLRPCAWGCREIVVTAATGAHRLIDTSLVVETA